MASQAILIIDSYDLRLSINYIVGNTNIIVKMYMFVGFRAFLDDIN